MLLDEPTAALGIVQTRQILELIKRLAERGLGVVVISHNLAERLPGRRPDRGPAARPRDGASLDADETKREEVVAAITGAEFGGEDVDRTTEEQAL